MKMLLSLPIIHFGFLTALYSILFYYNDFYPRITFWILILILLVFTVCSTYFRIFRNQKVYNQRINSLIFEENKKMTTQRCLDKLYKNKAFQEMMKTRGNDPAKWCWQSRKDVQEDSDEEFKSDE